MITIPPTLSKAVMEMYLFGAYCLLMLLFLFVCSCFVLFFYFFICLFVCLFIQNCQLFGMISVKKKRKEKKRIIPRNAPKSNHFGEQIHSTDIYDFHSHFLAFNLTFFLVIQRTPFRIILLRLIPI